MRIPLTFGHTEKQSTNINAGRCINMFPVVNYSDSKNQLTLTSTSGLEPWVLLKEGEVRGMYGYNNKIYAVSFNAFYEVDAINGDTTELGTISSYSGKVWIGFNTLSVTNGAAEFIVADGDNGWVYDLGTTTLSKISDEDFPGAESLAVVDQYALVVKPDSGDLYHSDLKDFTVWQSLHRVNATGDPDYLLSIIADHREIWCFGERSTEVFKNAGDQDFQFQRIDGTFQEVGINAPASPAKIDNFVFWLDNDLQVRSASGYNTQVVSTPAVADQIRGLNKTSDARGVTFIENGHTYYGLIFPSSNYALFFDIGESIKAKVPLWHSRSSGVDLTSWRGASVLAYQGNIFVGDSTNGYIHKLKDTVFTDNGETIRREFTSQEIFDDNERRMLMHRELELEIQAGTGLSGTGQGSDPEIMMQYSDDGGHTWSYESWRTVGKIGQYKWRARWFSLGQSRNRIYKFAVTDPVKIEGIAAYLKADIGTE